MLLFVAVSIASAAEIPARPNILFAIADDWGYGHASIYGAKWVNTPAFDRVAKQGVLFTHAYTPNAKCAPSRASILTGRNSWQLKEAANHICYFPTEFKTWAEALTEKGWHVGHTMKGWGPGIANDASGKPRLMTGKAYNARKAPPPTTGISNNDYAGNFNDFLNAAPTNTPWCFWYGSVEPHRGYEFGSGIAKGGKKLTDIDRVPAFWPDNDTVRTDMLDYAYEIEHHDRHLLRMLENLEKRGLLENTLVIATSDHGMPFPRVKGNAYEFANHIPMAIMWGRGLTKPGRTVDDYVSFIDIAPTLMEAAGLKWADTGMAQSPGRSLFDIIKSDKAGIVNAARDHVLIGKERHDIGRPGDVGYPIRGILKNGMLYLDNFESSRWPGGNPETGYLECDGGPTKTLVLSDHRKDSKDPHWAACFGIRPEEELFDLNNDPDCMKNLASDAASAKVRAALKDTLFNELKAQDDPRMFGQGAMFDKYLHATPENVNFYEKYMRGDATKAGWVNSTDFEKSPVSPK